MAKDDFFVILFKILTYYYGCMKNRYVFKEEVFFKIAKGNIDDSYFNKVLKDAVDMGYIKGLAFTHAWGDEYILSSDYKDGEITPEGIKYLTDNSKMEKIKEFLQIAGGLTSKLISFVL